MLATLSDTITTMSNTQFNNLHKGELPGQKGDNYIASYTKINSYDYNVPQIKVNKKKPH